MISNLMQSLYIAVQSHAGTWADTVFSLTAAFMLFNMFALFAVFGGWFERKLIARAHSRIGPMYTGKAGLLQTIADLLKFLQKQMLWPKGGDKMLFRIAPLLLTIPPFVAAVFVPIGSFVVVRSEYSLLFVLALLSFSPIAILVGSWASNSKYSTLGGLRAAGMTMSYEVLLGIAAASVALMAGSLDIVRIVEFQHQSGMWMLVMQPIAFFLFLIGALASVERNPFDLVEAESELVSGWKTEYGGVYFSLTLMGEYIKLLVTAFLFSSLFMGGWKGLGGDVGFILKSLLFVVFMMYVRATAIRLRLDQVFAKVWNQMVPLGILNFIVTVGVLEAVL